MWWEGVSLQKGEEGGASRMLQLLIRKKKSILTLPTATFLFFFAESRVMPPPLFFFLPESDRAKHARLIPLYAIPPSQSPCPASRSRQQPSTTGIPVHKEA